jgi:pyruvate kinase
VNDPSGGDDRPSPFELLDAVRALEDELSGAESLTAGSLQRLDPRHRSSGANLVHYLALRSHDVRGLQDRLARLGLSSLGRCEAHVQRSLGQVRAVLETLVGIEPGPVTGPVGFTAGAALLETRTAALLGPPRPERPNRIMVTLPGRAAEDSGLVDALVRAGMDCARINAAHDGPDAWVAMAAHVRKAAAQAGRTCGVQIDLAGPKLRTGPAPTRPAVLKLRVRRDDQGHRTGPARAWLDGGGPVPAEAGTAVPVPADWVRDLTAGTVLHVCDACGEDRFLTVHEPGNGGAWIQSDRTTRLTAGTPLRPDSDRPGAEVGPLPEREAPFVLRPGDPIVLSTDLTPAAPGPHRPARIGCTLQAVFDHIRVGDPIWFDDGRIGGTVTAVAPDQADISIHTASDTGAKLRGGKGINLPDTDLELPALTADDADALAFAAAHADLVALSFVQRPADVHNLLRELTDRGAPEIGVVLKIETRTAFTRLPELLLAAMATEKVGVMIARGDLAVECGFERLAEVQEEILRLCEAAHVPVIWATQVLNQLAKTGQPTRAEITDAARSVRAECVMLNKGRRILDAITTLDDILRRMHGHQHKGTPMLTPLHAWTPPVN